MTKQEAIRWLKEYIEQEDLVYQCGKGLEKRKKEISDYSKPFIVEKKRAYGEALAQVWLLQLLGQSLVP